MEQRHGEVDETMAGRPRQLVDREGCLFVMRGDGVVQKDLAAGSGPDLEPVTVAFEAVEPVGQLFRFAAPVEDVGVD